MCTFQRLLLAPIVRRVGSVACTRTPNYYIDRSHYSLLSSVLPIKVRMSSNGKSNNKRANRGGGGGGGRRAKKDKKTHQTWRRDYGENEDENGKDKTTPHPGSFATLALREKFGVVIDEALLTVSQEDNNEGDDNNDNNKTDDTPKKSKKKLAMFMGFLGTKYGGFQVNEGQHTLQAEIELAMFRSGMMSASNFGFPFKYSWSSSARTDKGVHAAAQVCSCKVELEEDELEDLEKARQRLNDALPSDIQVLDMERVTRKFCAKTQRDRVRYQYMLPSFVLHPDWISLLKANNVDMSVKRRGDGGDLKKPISDEDIKKLQVSLEGYRSTDESHKALKDALRRYEGTNFYHNFTRGLAPGQASAQRYIQSFVVQDPIIVDNVEWIPTQVLGQSFLLHQIRKMIGVAIDVARGAAPLTFMDRALSETDSMVIDVAPAQGLFLEMSYYSLYNNRKNQQNPELNDLDWTKDGPAKDRWSSFRDIVRSHIVQEEKEQGNFLHYMYRHEVVFELRKEYGLDEENPTEEKSPEAAEARVEAINT